MIREKRPFEHRKKRPKEQSRRDLKTGEGGRNRRKRSWALSHLPLFREVCRPAPMGRGGGGVGGGWGVGGGGGGGEGGCQPRKLCFRGRPDGQDGAYFQPSSVCFQNSLEERDHEGGGDWRGGEGTGLESTRNFLDDGKTGAAE